MKYIYTIIILTIYLITSHGQCDPAELPPLLHDIHMIDGADDTVAAYDAGKNSLVMTGEERIIYWLHGLGGDHTSWSDASQAVEHGYGSFLARKALSLSNLTYRQTSMADAIDDVQQYMLTGNSINSNSYTQKTDNFIIAHSQGGIVARGVDYQEDTDPYFSREFGGIITFGTPHQGAQILNNGLPIADGGQGEIQSFLDEACTQMSKGPVKEVVALQDAIVQSLLSAFGLTSTAIDITETGCEFFADDLLPFVLSDFIQDISAEYTVGANYLHTIATPQNNYPRMAFYGVEKRGEEFWKLMNSLMIDLNSEPTFGANQDETQLDYKQITTDYYNSMMFMASRADYHWSWCSWLTPWRCQRSSAYRDAQYAYRDGYHWLINANEYWMDVIGANQTTTVQNGYVCSCLDKNSPSLNEYTYIVQDPNDCTYDVQSGQLCHTMGANYVTTHTFDPNDGVVLSSSAKNMPNGIQPGNGTTKMHQTNHQQMRNNSPLETKLNAILNGQFSPYFYTSPK